MERDSVIMTEHYFDAGVGTLNFMAPEIIKNFINYNNTIDSWYFINIFFYKIKKFQKYYFMNKVIWMCSI